MDNNYLGKYENIESFELDYEQYIFEIYLIKKIKNQNQNIISIIINPSKNFSFNLYSTKLIENNIRNKAGETINLLNYFFQNKAYIISANDLEIIIGIESDNIYTNINLINFGKKDKYIYSITAKKNEYYIIWRDPNFQSQRYYGKHLDDRKLYCIREANKNIYSMSSTEEALKFVVRRRKENDKIIFITSIGKDLGGKRFIEIVRKIYKFNIMVLFYSNNKDHFKWIQEFPNCLYADRPNIFEEYITNYNIIGLKNLKDKIEKKFKNENLKIKDFSPDFLSVPLDDRIFRQQYNPYIRHVKILNKNKNKYLYMTENGEVKTKNNGTEECLWDVTFLNNTITFYSNNFYLTEEKEKAIGQKYMFEWNYKELKFKNDKNNEVHYCFINPQKEKNNILSIEDSNIKIYKTDIGKNEAFQLIDVLEDNKNIDSIIIDSSFISDLSNKIRDDKSSIDINDSKSKNLDFSNILDNLSFD